MLAPLLLVLATADATVPDTYGASARLIGMGGGGVALVEDGAAAWVNPAGLSRIRQPQAGIGILGGIDNFQELPSLWWDTNQDGQVDFDDPALQHESNVDDIVGTQMFAGRHLGGLFGFGVSMYLPLTRMFRFQTYDPSLPTYVMYDNRPQRYAFAAGVGGKPLPGLNLGVGFDVIPAVRLDTRLTADVSLTADGDGESLDSLLSAAVIDVHNIEVEIGPKVAPIVGMQLELGDWSELLQGFVLGFAWRGAVGLDVDVGLDSQVNAQIADVGELEPYLIGLVAKAGLNLAEHYTPMQVRSGIAWRTEDTLSATVDVIWTDWRPMAMSVAQVDDVDIDAPLVGFDDVIADGNAYQATLRPTVGVRLGTELRMPRVLFANPLRYLHLSLRGGFVYDPSPLTSQGDSSAFLDGDRTGFSLGLGAEHWDPLELVDAPMRWDLYTQVHLLRGSSLLRSSNGPRAGYPIEGNTIPVGGSMVVFGLQWSFDYN